MYASATPAVVVSPLQLQAHTTSLEEEAEGLLSDIATVPSLGDFSVSRPETPVNLSRTSTPAIGNEWENVSLSSSFVEIAYA